MFTKTKSVILSSLFFVLAGAVVVSAATLTSGNDTINRDNVDGYQNFTIVDTNNPVETDGEIYSFSYYATSTDPFYILVIDDSSMVKWISPEISPDLGYGEYNPVDPVMVEAGWNIGIYFPGASSIPFTDSGEPADYTANDSGMPAVDDVLTIQGTSARTYSILATGQTFPYGEITSPSAGENVSSTLDLAASYNDGDDVNDDAVVWGVYEGSCDGGTLRAGNHDGFSDGSSWDGASFSASLDISAYTLGSYCFSFDPTDDEGQENVSSTRSFNIVAPANNNQNNDEDDDEDEDNEEEHEGSKVIRVGEYKNHGQYVRSQENKREAAHSRNGMPVHSKGHLGDKWDEEDDD